MTNERLQIGYLEVKNRPLVNGTGVLLQGEAAAGGGTGPIENSVFNGNRQITAVPVLGTNYGGSTISGFLNNIFFPYVSANLTLNNFTNRTYGYDTVNSETFAGTLESKSDNVTGIACLFSNTILSGSSIPVVTNNTYSISPVNFLLSPPTPPSRQSTSSQSFITRIFGIRSGNTQFTQDSNSVRLRFEPAYFFGVSTNPNLGVNVTGLTRVNPSTYLNINGSNYNIGSRPSFINGLQFSLNSGYIYFAYPDFTNAGESITPWGLLNTTNGIQDASNFLDYTSTYTNSTVNINFPTRSNITYRIYRSPLLTPIVQPTTFTLNFKFV
jgi:hypothetical protein